MYCVLVCVGKLAIPVLWQFFELYPSAEVMRASDWKPLADLMQPLGLNFLRAKTLVRFSGKWKERKKRHWVFDVKPEGICLITKAKISVRKPKTLYIKYDRLLLPTIFLSLQYRPALFRKSSLWYILLVLLWLRNHTIVISQTSD